MAKKGSRTEMGVVLSDSHIPHNDPVVDSLVLDFLREQQPSTVHLLGDWIDFYQLSRFDKDPERALQLQGDLDKAEYSIANIRKAVPSARIIYSEGNHEYRLRRYLWSEAKELSGLRSLQLSELMHLDKFKVEWVDMRKPYKIGHLLYTHGLLVRRWSGYSARGHYEKFGCNVIHGHTHRLGSFWHSDFEKTFGAWENGCLCDKNPEYVVSPDWQQGWSVVWYYGDLFHVEQVPVIAKQYVYHGEFRSASNLARAVRDKKKEAK